MTFGPRRRKGMFGFRVLLLYCFALMCSAVATLGQGVPAATAVQDKTSNETVDPEHRALAGVPHYQRQQAVSGTMRLCGHGAPVLDFMGMLVKSWEEGFARFPAEVRFEYARYAPT